MHARTHTHTHTHVCTRTYTHINTHTHLYTHTHTKSIKNSLDPKWNSTFDFKLSSPLEAHETLKVTVYDEGLFGLRYVW